MGFEKHSSQRFQPKGAQELLAQALHGYSSNEQVTANRQELQALAEKAINTGKWEEVDKAVGKLSDDYEKVKSERLKIGFIKWQINRLKERLWQILYPNFNTNSIKESVKKLESVLDRSLNSRPNSTPLEQSRISLETTDLTQLTETITRIRALLSENPNNDSVLDQIKQEVVKLVQLLAQISEQMDKIKKAKDYLIKELTDNGFVQPLFQHLENLKGQIESQVSSLNIELETLREGYSPTQEETNIDKWKQQIQKKIQSLESEIQELERVKAEITELQEQIQQNQNASASNNPKLKGLTRNLKELKKLEIEMRDIIKLVVDNLWEINTLANKSLGSIETKTWEDYIDAIRWWRNNHEKEIRSAFEQLLEQNPLDPDLEQTIIEQLRRLIVNFDSPEELDRFRQTFRSGNFLYHGTKVQPAIQILFSGTLKSTKALQEESINKEEIFHNSGYEGVSWSLNGIEGLPGDRYHLVGFLAAPEEVLESEEQLTIPSRPVPYEVIQINRKIEPNEFYELKIQIELYNGLEKFDNVNSVISNLEEVSSFVADGDGTTHNFRQPFLIDFLERNQDDQKLANELRSLYQIRTTNGQLKNFYEIEQTDLRDPNNTIKLSEKLWQSEIPVAAVWIQALIDTGRINNDPNFAGATSVREVVEKLPGNPGALRKELMKELDYLDPLWQEQESKITPIRVLISKLYLVVPKHDLERYLRILARCDSSPKGIIVYDHRQVRLENFASLHRGDHAALTKWLQELIPPKTSEEGYIDYCQTFLGKPEISLEERTGYAKHIIKDSHIPSRPRIVRNGNDLAIKY